MRSNVPVLTAALLLLVGTGVAASAADAVNLTLSDHRFTPDQVTVPSGQRFKIVLTNQDDTAAELESRDMKFEKVVVPGGTITVQAGPLQAGTYKFFEEYHSDTAIGTITAVDSTAAKD